MQRTLPKSFYSGDPVVIWKSPLCYSDKSIEMATPFYVWAYAPSKVFVSGALSENGESFGQVSPKHFFTNPTGLHVLVHCSIYIYFCHINCFFIHNLMCKRAVQHVCHNCHMARQFSLRDLLWVSSSPSALFHMYYNVCHRVCCVTCVTTYGDHLPRVQKITIRIQYRTYTYISMNVHNANVGWV